MRIARREYKDLRLYFEDIAQNRGVEALADELNSLPFAAYAPVRRQLLNMLSAVNKKRKEAGYEQLPWSCLCLTRRNVTVFVE